MTEQHLTDERLAAAVRDYLPAGAPHGTAERVALALENAPEQLRRLPWALASVTDVDPVGRRRSLLLAAALIALAAAIGALAAGALRVHPDVPPDLSLAPPPDVQAYVVSAVQGSPIEPRPMTITAVADRDPSTPAGSSSAPIKTRILMDASGNVRIERFGSVDATEPAGYRIVTKGRIAELTHQGAEAVWVDEPFDGTPRDWISFVLSAYIGTADRFDCEMLELDPTNQWQYVGLEYILGRPVHHVRCGGELWIDVETRLILRSYGPLFPDGRPTDATTHTVEVTALEFRDQPAALFDPTRPPGVRAVSREEQQAYQDGVDAAAACRADPVCSAPDVPLPTLVPAGPQTGAADPETIVAAAIARRADLPPLRMSVERWRSKGGTVGVDTLYFERPDRFRVERARDTLAGTPEGSSIRAGDDGTWDLRTNESGQQAWLRLTDPRNIVDAGYMWVDGMLFTLPECGPPGGLPAGTPGPRWQLLGVDKVGRFTADHIACGDAESTWVIDGSEYACGCTGMEFWVDRDTHLVVRRLNPADGNTAIEVRQVLDLQFGPQPDELFRPPEGALIEVQPTPGPDAPSTPAPQPSVSGG
jgi:hypothetical protein